MSSQLFPTLIGQTANITRSPLWKSLSQESASGVVSAIRLATYVRTRFTLEFELLRDNLTVSEFKALVGLHNAMGGRVDTFLFQDPDFNTISAAAPQTFCTGDGTTLGPFPLVAQFANASGPGAPELIQNLNGTPVIYDNGSTVSAANYSIDTIGRVSFHSGHALAAGHVGSWSGSFYYRCRFDDDTIEWQKFMASWWMAQSVKFTSVILQ